MVGLIVLKHIKFLTNYYFVLSTSYASESMFSQHWHLMLTDKNYFLFIL